MGWLRLLLPMLLALPVLTPAAPPSPALDSPWPEPDPKAWWDEVRPKPGPAADPLAGSRGGPAQAARLPGAPDPLLYRLWGLPILQHQTLRRGELILEIWVRPSISVRQTVMRLVVRQDGEAFLQTRAGLICCTPEIGRRVGFDVELPAGTADRVAKLRDDPLWSAPRNVWVSEGGAAAAICVDGSSYDLILVTTDRARMVRRACDPAEVGQAADVLEAVMGLALGHDPRIDVLFPQGAGFDAARAAYRKLLAGGGGLEASHDARPPPAPSAPGSEDVPEAGPGS